MKLFRKKCAYCSGKINKGEEIFRDVKDPAFLGMKKKAFCSEEHAQMYVKKSKDCCNSGKGSCCG